jgi:hypothetical protein
LLGFATQHKYSEDRVFEKLRKEKSPRDYQVLFFAANITLKDLISRLRDWECVRKSANIANMTQNEMNMEFRSKFKYDKSKIQCFRCKKFGHYKSECEMNKEKINSVHNLDSGLDTREIYLNDQKCVALFDTGASDNFIGSKLIKDINGVVFDNLIANKEYSLVDGSKILIEKSVGLNLTYNSVKKFVRFNIINGECKSIIINNRLVKELNRSNINMAINQCVRLYQLFVV